MEDDVAEPWHACRTGWCAGVDHVSVSLVNQDLPYVYAQKHSELHVAFVLSADTSFECAMVVDGGTVMTAKGGCTRPTCPGGWCVYRPNQVADFVRAHLSEVCGNDWCRDTYNEVVILKGDWEDVLPHSILAVACLRTDPDDDDGCQAARDVHARFLDAYGRSAGNVPLVR